MKTNQELLDFYGVELGKTYEITQERYLHLNSDRRFIAEIDKATDEARIRLLHKDGSPFLNNWAISMLDCCEYHEIKPLLTDEEKDYLKTVIKPFRDRILRIYKTDAGNFYEGGEVLFFDLKANDYFYLPELPLGKMFSGMEQDKKYTLEELGI